MENYVTILCFIFYNVTETFTAFIVLFISHHFNLYDYMSSVNNLFSYTFIDYYATIDDSIMTTFTPITGLNRIFEGFSSIFVAGRNGKKIIDHTA